MSEAIEQNKKQMLKEALRRMLLCAMPEALRASIHDLLDQTDSTEYELKSAYTSYAKRLVLARPRADIHWNPTVDSIRRIGCGDCFNDCPHGVF